jgi:hypothetical protein
MDRFLEKEAVFVLVATCGSPRSYRNGFVWHDLAENDFIYPAHGQEYVLKGSEHLDPCLNSKIHDQKLQVPKFQVPTRSVVLTS